VRVAVSTKEKPSFRWAFSFQPFVPVLPQPPPPQSQFQKLIKSSLFTPPTAQRVGRRIYLPVMVSKKLTV
jgi:hypothetical protein